MSVFIASIRFALVVLVCAFTVAQAQTYKYFRLGNPSDVQTKAKFGIAMMGGGSDLDEAFRDPQVGHRRLVAEVEGEAYGPSSPMRFDGEQLVNLSRAPGFGEHTAEVLGEIGVDEKELQRLRDSGAI